MMTPRIVILTGAGISAESGMGTFRDAGGLWTRVRLEDVATPEAFARDPVMVLEFYDMRRERAEAKDFGGRGKIAGEPLELGPLEPGE